MVTKSHPFWVLHPKYPFFKKRMTLFLILTLIWCVCVSYWHYPRHMLNPYSLMSGKMSLLRNIIWWSFYYLFYTFAASLKWLLISCNKWGRHGWEVEGTWLRTKLDLGSWVWIASHTQQFLNLWLQKKIKKAPSVKGIVICMGHKHILYL